MWKMRRLLEMERMRKVNFEVLDEDEIVIIYVPYDNIEVEDADDCNLWNLRE